MKKKEKTIELVAPKGSTWRDVLGRVIESRKRQGKIIKCKMCGEKFKVTTFCFHGLCDDCFCIFDAQKMAGRVAYNFEGDKNAEWFEDADKWVKAVRRAEREVGI